MSEWFVHYFDPQLGKEVESRQLASLIEAVSVAESYERQGCSVRHLAGPHGKLHWPLSRPRHPRSIE